MTKEYNNRHDKPLVNSGFTLTDSEITQLEQAIEVMETMKDFEDYCNVPNCSTCKG